MRRALVALVALGLASSVQAQTKLRARQIQTAGTPTTVDPSVTTALEGTSQSLARADHVHAFGEYRTVYIPGSWGDGVQNARSVIQAALDSGAGQPVIVKLPPGTFKVYPPADVDGQYPGSDCLSINYSNVVLEGAGPRLTTISCFPAGGTSPATTWEVLDSGGTPTVWRGRGIAINASSVWETPTVDIHIRGLRLTGNSGPFYPNFQFYGGPAFPADPGTGANWDLTNQGIFVGNGSSLDDVYIEDCEIDGFRAELVYYGGAGLRDLYITRSVLHDSIGSIVSTSGRLHLTDSEIYGGYNAVENTPNVAGGLYEANNITGNFIHDNVIGVVITANVDVRGDGKVRVRVENNRISRNYRGAVWVRGGIAGMIVKNNDIADCGQGTDTCVLIGAAYGYAPEDITVESNVFRAETVFVGSSVRVANDPGYPVKNIRILDNRIERSKYVKDGGGTFGLMKFVLWDATSTVFVEGNDFAGGGSSGVQVGDSYGTGDAAVPYFGWSRSNKWYEHDTPGGWDFVGIATSTMALRPNHVVHAVVQPASGYNTVTSMGTTGIPTGQRAFIRSNGGADRGTYFPATGTGWRFRRPYWITSWGANNTYPLLAVRYSGGVWVEDDAEGLSSKEGSLGFYADLAPPLQAPVESSTFWLSGATADTFAPTIPFYYTRQVTLAPTAPRTYTTWSDAPPGEVVTVAVNANVTIQQSATLKLVGGTSFAPGGTGGVMTFTRPKGSTVLYEVSRMAY